MQESPLQKLNAVLGQVSPTEKEECFKPQGLRKAVEGAAREAAIYPTFLWEFVPSRHRRPESQWNDTLCYSGPGGEGEHSSLLFHCCDKTLAQNNLFGLHSYTTIRHEGKTGKAHKTGTWRQGLKQRLGRNDAFWLVPRSYTVHDPWWLDLLHQSAIKKGSQIYTQELANKQCSSTVPALTALSDGLTQEPEKASFP